MLRTLRIEKGIRQQDLAAALGEPQSFISKVESGERRLDLLELRKFCLALGTSLTDFTRMLEQELDET